MNPLRLAVVIAGALCCAACAPARVATPPEPSLVTGERADASTTTSVRRSTPTSSIVPPAGTATGSTAGAATTSTSTTTTLPHPTGWAGFDEIVSYDLLSHGDTSASVAVMIDGELVHAAAFGVRAAGTFDPTEPVDRFRIASVSKVITAIVTLQLVEDGSLVLDEPIGERVASYLGVTPTLGAAQITAEQLLSHTSGLGVYYATFFQGGASSCPDAARQGLTGGVSGGYRYSNMNYCVLGMLIEAVTGLSYEEAVYERLLTPLGITGMRLASTFDVGPDEVLHASKPGRTYMETLGAAGSWIATPTDLVRIVDSLNPGGTGWKPLSDEMGVRMRRGRYGISGVAAFYGLGLFNYFDGSFGHTGTIESTHAMVVGRPDRITWALVVNGEYPANTSDLKSIVDNALDIAFD